MYTRDQETTPIISADYDDENDGELISGDEDEDLGEDDEDGAEETDEDES